MHDDLIISYEVNFFSKTIVLNTKNEAERRKGKLEIFDVLTYSFECALDYNQILDINEWGIDSFIRDNISNLKQMKNYCWPIDYQSIPELEHYLKNNFYKYIKITSSYGMYGWVLAKSYKIS